PAEAGADCAHEVDIAEPHSLLAEAEGAEDAHGPDDASADEVAEEGAAEGVEPEGDGELCGHDAGDGVGADTGEVGGDHAADESEGERWADEEEFTQHLPPRVGVLDPDRRRA